MPESRTVARVERRVEPPLALDNELHGLREQFSELADEAVRAIQSAGLDLDDCVLDRYATLRHRHSTIEHRVAVETLTNWQKIANSFSDKELGANERASLGDSILVVAVEMHVRQVPDFPKMRPEGG